jgi:hypothetical protein
MPHLLVRHRVADYARWRPIFDDHASFREQHGSTGGQVFRNADDPAEVVMLFEVSDLDRAREFVRSDELKEAMQSAGVVGAPDVAFLDDEDPTAT